MVGHGPEPRDGDLHGRDGLGLGAGDVFATPVAIQANTVYVASYFAPNGHYSGNLNYFATHGVDTPPLHALANGVAGGNGVYAYGGANSFPNSTYQALNYWVDVVFSTSAQ